MKGDTQITKQEDTKMTTSQREDNITPMTMYKREGNVTPMTVYNRDDTITPLRDPYASENKDKPA